MKSPIRILYLLESTPRLVVSGRCFHLASEDAVAEERVEQHQREDDHASPEHERKTGLRGGSFVDGDDERNDVGPEGQRESAECRHENQRDHVERPMVIATQDAEREHDRGDPANRRECEEIRPIDPAMQDRKMFSKRVNEDDDEKHQYGNREDADLAVRPVANLGVAFLHQPAGAEKRVAKAQADATQDRKWREPAEVTAGILTVRDLQSFDESPDRDSLHEAREQGAGRKAQIPDPAHLLCLVAKLECYTAKDQARQYEKQWKIEGR